MTTQACSPPVTAPPPARPVLLHLVRDGQRADTGRRGGAFLALMLPAVLAS